jgi:hypothetical protein
MLAIKAYPVLKAYLRAWPAPTLFYLIFNCEGGNMGPYYRETSQGIGGFFDMFYQHPILMLVLVVGMLGTGFLVWHRLK